MLKKTVSKYFEPGDSFMSCDHVHHQVELAMKKKKGKIYNFQDFVETVTSANFYKIIIKGMLIINFIKFYDYTSQRRI